MPGAFLSLLLIFVGSIFIVDTLWLLLVKGSSAVWAPPPGADGVCRVLCALNLAGFVSIIGISIWGGLVTAHFAAGTGFWSHLGLGFTGFLLCGLAHGNVANGPGDVYEARNCPMDEETGSSPQFLANVETARRALVVYLVLSNLGLLLYLILFCALSASAATLRLQFLDDLLLWNQGNSIAATVTDLAGLCYLAYLLQSHYSITRGLRGRTAT